MYGMYIVVNLALTNMCEKKNTTWFVVIQIVKCVHNTNKMETIILKAIKTRFNLAPK